LEGKEGMENFGASEAGTGGLGMLEPLKGRGAAAT